MNEKDKKDLELIVDIIKNTVKVEEIYLFGSFAYGTPTEDSDFDIYVLLKEGADRPIVEMQKIYAAIFGVQSRAVDVLADDAKRFYDSCKDSQFKRTVMEKGIKLFFEQRENNLVQEEKK